MVLRPIFAPKMKTASPQRDWGTEVVKDLLLFGPEKWSFCFPELTQNGQEKGVDFGEDLFIFFGDHLKSAGKTFLVLVKTFFWRSPGKTASI